MSDQEAVKEPNSVEKPVSNDAGKTSSRPEGWLNSHMTFLMVLLNGFILTGTAFAILTVFINEMRNEDSKMVTDHFREIVENNFREVEKVIDVTTAITRMNGTLDQSLLKRQYELLGGNLRVFDQIDIVSVQDGGQGAISMNPVYIDEDAAVSPVVSDDIIKDIMKSLRISPQAIVKYDVWQEEDKFFTLPSADDSIKMAARPILIAQNIFSVGTAHHILLYKTSFAKMFSDGQFRNWEEVSLYQFQTPQGLPMMQVDFDNKLSNAGVSHHSYEDTFEENLLGQTLQLNLKLKNNQRNAFLGTIPYLMLMFGGVLTIIGTLYVHNNQKQSLKLSKMNKALAQKNIELNKQVSERERLFQAMNKSEKEHRNIINSVSDIIFEATEKGEILFLNDSWTSLTGLEIKKSLHKSLFDLVHPEDKDELRDEFDKIFTQKNANIRMFLRLKTITGRFREVEIAVSTLKKDDKNIVRTAGIITDLEERRKAEQALAEAEKKYRNIVENASAGIFQVTPEGQFLSANPALAKMLGYETPYELMQEVTDFGKQLHADPKERDLLIKKLEQKGALNNYEIRLLHKKGYELWVTESSRVVKDENDKIKYFEGIMEDITQRRNAEIALKQAKSESDLANRAKSEFLANMSHELRTPLNAIIGFSEIIKNEVFGPVGQKEYNEYAADIYNSGRRLLKVINEILDVSKITAGDRQLNETLVNINDAVRSCCALILPKMEASSLTLENDLSDDIPAIIGEELAIKQMVMNLMSNAVKFTQSGGHIIITSDLDKDEHFRLSITDTGIGMDTEEVQKAISPFGQLDSSLGRENSGTGLGLTLVDSLIKLHGGELEITSQKGIGTTATLVFPAKRVARNRGGQSVSQRDIDASKNVVRLPTDTK